DPGTVARAGAIHRSLLEDRQAVEPNLAGAVVGVVAHSGGATEHRQFVDRWHEAATPQEEIRYLYALADFPSAELMAETLRIAGAEARTQNAPFLIARALANPRAGQVAWAHVRDHWDELLARLPDATVSRMLGGIVWLWDDAGLLAPEVETFLDTHPFPPGDKTIAQLRDRLMVNATFARRRGDAVRAALGAASRPAAAAG
ncbi:MAG TPA: ERAP1-like C-terminal domain-containing protein, partial [Acidimicrobiales bacterium]